MGAAKPRHGKCRDRNHRAGNHAGPSAQRLNRKAYHRAKRRPEPLIELSPEDAVRFGVDDAQWVKLYSRRGLLRADH